MKRISTLLAGLLLAAGISVSFAQGGPGSRGCDGMGPQGSGPHGMHAGMRFDPAQRAERHLAVLKDQLKLTAEQEPLWQAFAEKAQSTAGQGFKAMRAQAADPNLTAPERMAKMQQMMQARVAAMATVQEHFNRLYAALTPEQKQVADQHAARMGRGGMGPGPGRMMPPAAPPAPQG